MKQMRWHACWLAILLIAAAGGLRAQDQNTPIPLEHGQLVAFLGDSITQQNLYTRYVEFLLNARYPELELRFVNVGWSGRHAAHVLDDSVLQRDLLRLKPDVVLILFGMNDGWYRYPPAQPAIASYQSNMDALVSKIQTGLPTTHIVLLTPSISDPLNGAGIKGYNDTLAVMSQYMSDLAARRGLPLIDLNKPMREADSAAKATDPTFSMIPDGIHPNPMGHWLMASVIARAFGTTPGTSIRLDIDAPAQTAVAQLQTTVSDIVYKDGMLTFTQTLPRVPVVLPLEARGALSFPLVQFTRDRATLEVSNLSPTTLYGVYSDNHLLGRYTGADLAAGIEWTNPKQENVLTDRVLALAMQKFQYHWTAWRAPSVGLAEVDPATDGGAWAQLDAAMTTLTATADANERQALAAAKVMHWSIMPETPRPIAKWEVNGPYNYQIFAVAYPPETGSETLPWGTMSSVNGLLDFNASYGQYRNSALYARARIYVPHAAILSLSAGSDGSLKAWVNGTLCLANDTYRNAQPDQDTAIVPLQAGWNTILLRENRGLSAWSLYAQAYLSGLTAADMAQVRTSPE